jgi:glycerol dehydrogenase
LCSNKGIFDPVCYQRASPAVILVDLDIIVKAPTRFPVAGMGDALVTWFEARPFHRTRSVNECGGLSTSAGLHIAKLCYETLLVYGVKAKAASERHIVTPAFDEIVEANIPLSGTGFKGAGLASAHSIHNGLTALAETHQFYHGEKVVGVLAGLMLTAAGAEELETVCSFCEDVELPATLADIGLGNVGRDKLMIAAEKACAPGQPIHHEEGTVTSKQVFEAMLAADAMGRARRN